jgi:hypothetical protein
MVRRPKSFGTIGALLVAALASTGAALAFGHKYLSWGGIFVVAMIVVLPPIGMFVWFTWNLLGTRWTLFEDRLEMRMPIAKTATVRRADIARVRRESISGFGIQEPIYVFEDRFGRLLFWTSARSWSDKDVDSLWAHLGVNPIDAIEVVRSYETLPYDRRW